MAGRFTEYLSSWVTPGAKALVREILGMPEAKELGLTQSDVVRLALQSGLPRVQKDLKRGVISHGALLGVTGRQ